MSNPFALIIEDDEDLAIIFEGALKEAGFETEKVQDGQLALDRLANTTPTVVVLDLHLPNISGDNILRQIREDKRLIETRVILATADALMAEEIREQADLVLLKPVSFDQLRDLAGRLRPSDTEVN